MERTLISVMVLTDPNLRGRRRRVRETKAEPRAAQFRTLAQASAQGRDRLMQQRPVQLGKYAGKLRGGILRGRA